MIIFTSLRHYVHYAWNDMSALSAYEWPDYFSFIHIYIFSAHRRCFYFAAECLLLLLLFINGKYDFVFSLFNEWKKRLFKSIEDKWRASIERESWNWWQYWYIWIENSKNGPIDYRSGDFCNNAYYFTIEQLHLINFQWIKLRSHPRKKNCESFIFIISLNIWKIASHLLILLKLFTIRYSLLLCGHARAAVCFSISNGLVKRRFMTFAFFIFFPAWWIVISRVRCSHTLFNTQLYVSQHRRGCATSRIFFCLCKTIRWHLTLTGLSN